MYLSHKKVFVAEGDALECFKVGFGDAEQLKAEYQYIVEIDTCGAPVPFFTGFCLVGVVEKLYFYFAVEHSYRVVETLTAATLVYFGPFARGCKGEARFGQIMPQMCAELYKIFKNEEQAGRRAVVGSLKVLAY